MNFKKFVYTFIGFSFFCLFAILAFNCYVDPANLVRNKNIDYAVSNMINGKGIIKLVNTDERIFVKKLINESNKMPETIVLGSSRSMGISKTFFDDDRLFFNYSVSGADIRDYISIWFTFLSHFKSEPQKIIFGLDPWIFNNNANDSRWESLSDEYYDACLLIELDVDAKKKCSFSYIKKIKELLSISYLKESLKLKKENIVPEAVAVTDSRKETVIMPDGWRKYGTEFNNISKNLVEKRVNSYISGNIYKLNEYQDLDTYKFEKFIRYLKGNNIEIIFYLPPYHPKVYSYMLNKSQYKNVENAEIFLRNFALENKIKVYGSYNPKKCGVNSQDFADGMHMKASGYQKIFFNKI